MVVRVVVRVVVAFVARLAVAVVVPFVARLAVAVVVAFVTRLAVAVVVRVVVRMPRDLDHRLHPVVELQVDGIQLLFQGCPACDGRGIAGCLGGGQTIPHRPQPRNQ